MAVNRASNSRFMVRVSLVRTGEDAASLRRCSSLSTFTATPNMGSEPLSRCRKATSVIIERINRRGYEIWKVGYALWKDVPKASRLSKSESLRLQKSVLHHRHQRAT